MPDPKFLDDLMDLLSPRGLSTSAILKDTPIDVQVRLNLIDKSKTFADIAEIINGHFSTKTPGPDSGSEALPYNFHAISTQAEFTICEKPDYKDTKYWLQNAPKEMAAESTLMNAIFGNIFEDAKCEVAIFVSTDPYLTPAAASTEDVEMFLNYTPPIIANQMLPYLEVEFSSNKAHNHDPSFGHLSSPSLLRFLLGSVQRLDPTTKSGLASGFSVADSALIRIEKGENNTKGQATSQVLAGMELFLSPQSLTNMKTIKSSATRLMDVKPFIPFASINNFEVTIANAGAGAMISKQGKLTLTIHDKARISEMSEFFRGPVGYSSLKVWTSYGWLMPRLANSKDDEYAKFINEKMHAEDCWQIKNSQFSFDQSGKVNVTIDLVSFGSSQIKKTSITVAKGYQSFLNGFNKMLEEIQEASQDIRKLPLGPDARITQVLNAAASGGMLPADLKPEQFKDIMKSVSMYAMEAGMSPDASTKLIKDMERVLDQKKYKAGMAIKRAESIKTMITDVFKLGYDPFIALSRGQGYRPLAKEKGGEGLKYFDDRLVKELNYFFLPPVELSAEEKKKAAEENKSKKDEPKRAPISISADQKVMSFGKLFCALAVPAILAANDATLKNNPNSELQIIFYVLNDQCGPVSGQSVAEFPIDIERLAYSLDDIVKAKSKTSDLTIEEFLKVIINSQFADDRAIGYGMLSKNLFSPFDKDKPGPAKAEKNTEYESKMGEWQSQNATFAKPIIEMIIETAKNEINTATRVNAITSSTPTENQAKAITRIHIYDKQNNPRKLFTQVASMSGKLFVGAFDERELRRKLKSSGNDKLGEEAIIKMLAQIKSGELTEEQAAVGAGIKFKDAGGADTPIPLDAKLFGENGIRANLRKLAPTLEIGTNGTLIKSATVASKTDDLMAAANLVNIMKPKSGGSSNGTDPPGTGIEGPGGLPLRTIPASLSMSTVGCPAARCYQQYFVDLGTGTSLDNLYTCTQVTHKIDPGKFETSMTFAFSDGYGKYTSPPTITSILTGAAKGLKRAKEAAEAQEAANNKKKKPPVPAKKPTKSPAAAKDPPPTPPEYPKSEENPAQELSKDYSKF